MSEGKFTAIIPASKVVQMQKPPGGRVTQITQRELAECVVLMNEIKLFRAELQEKCVGLRQRLKEGEAVEEGPLEGFATQIVKGRFLA